MTERTDQRDAIAAALAADITALEAELDRLVSGLYGLTVPETGGAG